MNRWVKAGRLIKLAREKYALARYDLIPEAVAVVTSVTTARPRVLENALGTFRYRHIRRELFWGFVSEKVHGRECVIALTEKAILDLLYIRPG